MAEFGGPFVFAVWEGLVDPSGLVADDVVVVAAEGGEVGGDGGPALCVGDAVVEVAVGGVGTDSPAVSAVDVTAATSPAQAAATSARTDRRIRYRTGP